MLTLSLSPLNADRYVKPVSWRKSNYFYLYSYKLYPFLDAETFHIMISSQF